PKGMSLTRDGLRLLAKAEYTLAAHHELMAEAARGKGELAGRLRLGAGSNTNNEAIGRLLTTLAERWPSIEVVLKHRTSQEVLAGIRDGTLDAGFYNEPGEPDPDLATLEVAQFSIHLAAAPGLVTPNPELDWKFLAELAWIYPTESACCGRTAEQLFGARRFRPRRVISADRQDVTITLIASGVGVGLLHADTAREAVDRGELELLFEAERRISVRFASLASRALEPMIAAASSILRGPALALDRKTSLVDR
ncbi:MAG TPA: substrate-binding domain-containing protein, partial [Polyangiaceae bacterium]|nr:substrate-binding domain-containing protein [Polyangiaceae bacterium]